MEKRAHKERINRNTKQVKKREKSRNEEKEDMESGERLRGWIRTYGGGESVRVATSLINRIRGREKRQITRKVKK